MLRAASPQRRFFDVVSRLHPRGGAATGVAGDAAPGLAGLRVQGDGNVGLGSDFKVNGVRVNDLSSGNLDGFLPIVESKGFDGGDVDSGYAGLTAGRETNRRRRNGQVAAAKGIADLDTDAVGANGHVEGLSEGCVLEYTTAGLVCFVIKLTYFFFKLDKRTYKRRRRHVVLLNKLRHRRPSSDPFLTLSGLKDGENIPLLIQACRRGKSPA